MSVQFRLKRFKTRDRSLSASVLSKRRTGVYCRGCSWRSYRTTEFIVPLDEHITLSEATDAAKGVPSYPKCPHCGGLVVFTHVCNCSK